MNAILLAALALLFAVFVASTILRTGILAPLRTGAPGRSLRQKRSQGERCGRHDCSFGDEREGHERFHANDFQGHRLHLARRGGRAIVRAVLAVVAVAEPLALARPFGVALLSAVAIRQRAPAVDLDIDVVTTSWSKVGIDGEVEGRDRWRSRGSRSVAKSISIGDLEARGLERAVGSRWGPPLTARQRRSPNAEARKWAFATGSS